MRRLIVPFFLLLAAPAQAEVLEELELPTRDGAIVHVELARPDGDAKVPVILTYSPYNTLSGSPASNLAAGSEWVEKGYARAYADVVGTRNSTGCWDYGGPIEQRSGADVVTALAGQSWSNGKVAMQGTSYDGTTATMVAAAGDVPGLAAIVPVAAISRWYGYAYQDGVRYLGNSENPTDEGFDTPLGFDFGFGKTPPDRPAAAQAMLDRMMPCDAVEHTQRGYEVDPAYDEFWLERDYLKDAAKVRVPAFVVHGWQDYNVKQSEGTDLYEALTNVPFKLAHFMQAPHSDGEGDEYEQRLERFFARTLKGEDNGIEFEPAVRTQTRSEAEAGDFERTTAWPPPGTRTVTYTVGALDPIIDTGTAAEEAGTVVWESEPLAEPLRIAGSAKLRVRVSVDDTAGHLNATLVDVAPGGGTTAISRGHHNLRFRGGLAAPEPIPAGEPVDATVRLAPQDQTVEKGHRLGLIVAGSNVAWAVPVPGVRTLKIADANLDLPVVGPVDPPGATPPPAATPAPAASLTARLRRVNRRHVRVSGKAPAGSRLRIRLRTGKRLVRTRRLTASGSRYAIKLRTRKRPLRAHVRATQVGGGRTQVTSNRLR